MKNNKICEIDNGYHCSIIGTCLSLIEVRNLLGSCYEEDFSECSDYLLHGMAVNGAGSASRFSNKLNEKLNGKYKTDVYKSLKLDNSFELEKYWEKSVEEGNIAGPYWAVLSHPECSDNLRTQVFGEVHMLSHLAGASERTNLEELNQKELRISGLEKQVEDDRDRLADSEQKIRKLQKEKRELFKQLKLLKIHEKANKNTEDDVEALKAETEKLKRKLQASENRNHTLQRKVFDLMEELNSHRTFPEEENLFPVVNVEPVCGGQSADELPTDLEGRKVLLVGGRASMVPHCKSVVEVMNGSFSYHDGGREQSRIILQKQVQSADIVICALDCVSHDASRCVKRMCNDQQMVIMMKKSGLSSFARELKRVV